MLAALLNIPNSREEWSIWSWHHRLSHDAIRQALQAQRGVLLQDYVLDPIAENDIKGWLQRNFLTHTEMDAALGRQSIDLEDVDFSNQQQKVSWVYYHYLEHLNAEQALGI